MNSTKDARGDLAERAAPYLTSRLYSGARIELRLRQHGAGMVCSVLQVKATLLTTSIAMVAAPFARQALKARHNNVAASPLKKTLSSATISAPKPA